MLNPSAEGLEMGAPIAYATRYCALLQRDVEVILIRQPDGTWVPARCVEKQKRCVGHTCPIRMHEAQASLRSSWC